MNIIEALIEDEQNEASGDTDDGNLGKQMSDLVYTSIAPTLITLINFILIPTVIDSLSYYLNYKTHSQRHFANFHKLFVFLIFVTLFIPLLGLASFD
jgi:hypothetical protein